MFMNRSIALVESRTLVINMESQHRGKDAYYTNGDTGVLDVLP